MVQKGRLGDRMKIIVDAFGGDNAPLAVIKGAADAVSEYSVDIILTGNKDIISKTAEENGISLNGIEIAHTTEVMDMHDQPTEIIRSKKNTSLGLGLTMLSEDKGDAFVSAGSTGAIVAGGTFIVKRLKGVTRAAIGTVLPTRSKNVLLMDCGANADCRPEMIAQFGVMASSYMEKVMGIKNPEIALLNIGTEDTKGGELQLQSYKLLKESPINFVGNIESRDLPAAKCDAVVTDGFTGNIALKLYEGVAMNMMSMLKDIFKSSMKTKLAAAMVISGLRGMKEKMDSSKVGGAVLLGVKKPVIKAHGNSNSEAIKNAIGQAVLTVKNDVIGSISKGL